MVINTKYFGEVEIDEDRIIDFNEGIFGFENESGFVILNMFELEDFACLQSLRNKNTAFIVIKPWHMFSDYEVNISNHLLKDINIKEEKEVALYNIVSITGDIKEATANLLAPIIINIEQKKGKQYILKDDIYHTRHQIFTQEKV